MFNLHNLQIMEGGIIMVGDGVEILCTDKIEVKHTERTHSSSNCVLCIFLI